MPSITHVLIPIGQNRKQEIFIHLAIDIKGPFGAKGPITDLDIQDLNS